MRGVWSYSERECVRVRVRVSECGERMNAVDVVLGAQWGDEGKGKLVDMLSQEYSVCARVAGGSNAGHTIVVDVRTHVLRCMIDDPAMEDQFSFTVWLCMYGYVIIIGLSQGKKYKFHLVPSGILNRNSTCVIGNGVVVHVPSLLEELKQLEEAGVEWKGRLFISDR